MKQLLIISALLMGISNTLLAQVGIGVASPNTGSILDLTNVTDKSLVLPKSSIVPTSVAAFSAEGMLFYFSDKLYLRTSSTTTVVNSWTFSGTTADGISTPSGMPLGIGVAPLASSPVNLQIANSTDVTVSTSTASIGIGTTTGAHLLIDNDEILAKTNATTAGTLKLQEDGGTVSIRTGAGATTAVLSANGSINAAGSGKILQNGLDLIPSGTILMWSGSVDGSGYPLIGGVPNTNWRICDGTSGTPDLRERFIVGSGGDNPSVPSGAYASGATGGENTHVLTVAEMATHNHSGSTSADGAHTHTLGPIPNGGEGYALSYNGSNEAFDWDETFTATTSTGGVHSHSLTTNNTGSGAAHENRPPYYALIYIIKL